MKKIKSFEVIDHGIDHSQFFQGCGTAYTKFDHCATGCGSNAREAWDDALNQIADNADTTRLDRSRDGRTYNSKRAEKFSVYRHLVKEKVIKRGGDVPEDSELYYYVSIRYNVK